jgi:hypothetical protein
MPPKIAQVLNATILHDLLDEHTPIEAIVEKLFMKGAALAEVITQRQYASFQEFKDAHAAGQSEIAELEGPSDIDPAQVVILKGCPMAATMKQLGVNGTPPPFFRDIVQGYIEQNPGSEAILHPGCIAHQVARQLVTRHIAIAGKNDLNFYQLACRNMATGAVVFDRNGLEKTGMSEATAASLIDGQACLYALVKTS